MELSKLLDKVKNDAQKYFAGVRSVSLDAWIATGVIIHKGVTTGTNNVSALSFDELFRITGVPPGPLPPWWVPASRLFTSQMQLHASADGRY